MSVPCTLPFLGLHSNRIPPLLIHSYLGFIIRGDLGKSRKNAEGKSIFYKDTSFLLDKCDPAKGERPATGLYIISILKTSFDDDAEFSVEIIALGSDSQVTLPNLRINFCFT